MRSGDNVGCATLAGYLKHREALFDSACAVVKPPEKMIMNINHRTERLPSYHTAGSPNSKIHCQARKGYPQPELLNQPIEAFSLLRLITDLRSAAILWRNSRANLR